MTRRELSFAAALTACSGLVTLGVWLIFPPAGLIAGGLLFGGLSYLVLSE